MIQWSNFLSDNDVFVEESNLVVIMLASVTNGESKNGIRRVAVVEMEVSDEAPRRRRCCRPPPP